MKLLIDKATIVTMDRDRRIIKNGAVAIYGDRIMHVGKSEAIITKFSPDRIINAEGKIALPGLIDAHAHVVSSLNRGLADDVDSFTRLHQRIYPFEAEMNEEDAYLGTLLGCLEMVRSGTTCFADPGISVGEGAAMAVQEAGIRGVLARRYVDVADPHNPPPQSLMATVQEAVTRHSEFFHRFNGAAAGRVRVWIGMGDPQSSSEAMLLALKNLADKHRTGMEIHAAVVRREEKPGSSEKRLSDIEYLDHLGVLGPNVLLAHANWISDTEVELIKKHGTKVCHCPGAGMHGGYGAISRGKLPELVRAGVTVCLGTDAAANNNSLDMFHAVYQAATCHKDARLDPALISPEEALEMATVSGARALMWDKDIGSIESGKKADLILVNAARADLLPLHDFSIVPNLVYSGDGANVDTVIVDGRVIMEKGEIRTVDEKQIVAKAQEAGVKILERMGLGQKLKPRWPVV